MSEDKFKFRCKHCENKLKASVELIGERIRCPHCNKPIAIPDPSLVPEETSSRQIHGLGTESQKVKKVDLSNSALRKADTRKQQKAVAKETKTGGIDREPETTTSKAIEECTAENKTKTKAPKKKKLSMGATKSVKLTSSQKKMIKPKGKSFKIKKK